jgi:hypothetical protein
MSNCTCTSSFQSGICQWCADRWVNAATSVDPLEKHLNNYYDNLRKEIAKEKEQDEDYKDSVKAISKSLQEEIDNDIFEILNHSESK